MLSSKGTMISLHLEEYHVVLIYMCIATISASFGDVSQFFMCGGTCKYYKHLTGRVPTQS